jgi:hypothetical protein
MHTIASAIVGSLQTSTAPTGSRTLPPPGILPLRLGAQLSRGRRCGAPGPVAGQPAQSQANAEDVPLHLFSYGSLGRGYGLDPSEWPVQLRVYAVGPPGNSNSQGRQHLRGSTRRRPICVKQYSSLVIRAVRSSNGLDSPRWLAQLRLLEAVGHPGASSSDSHPAEAPRGGGHFEWQDHSGLSSRGP